MYVGRDNIDSIMQNVMKRNSAKKIIAPKLDESQRIPSTYEEKYLIICAYIDSILCTLVDT